MTLEAGLTTPTMSQAYGSSQLLSKPTAISSGSMLVGNRKISQSTTSSFKSNTNNVGLSAAQRKRRQKDAQAQNLEYAYNATLPTQDSHHSRKYNHSTERGSIKSNSLVGGRLEPLPPRGPIKKGGSVAGKSKNKRNNKPVDVVLFPPTSTSLTPQMARDNSYSANDLSQQDYLI